MRHNKNIILVEDDLALQEALVDTLELHGFKVRVADHAEKALLLVKEQIPGIILSDVQLGGMSGIDLLRSLESQGYDIPVIMMTAYAQIEDAVIAMRHGAVDYLSKPFKSEHVIELLKKHAPLVQGMSDKPIVGDPSSQEFLALAERVAATPATVMITGPSGSGKEVLARYIHQQSQRADGPFIAINCAAIPENMLEATLFGYEKGAFTGAVQSCVGKFEQANGGTLLLDEITEMDISLQAKLLRVLQERRVERLGGRKEIPIDVRVLATSNRDVKEAVAQQQFREDLYYRLNVFPLTWKALAQRSGDILPLAEYLLKKHIQIAGSKRVDFDLSAKKKLMAYSWPGNVRELENVVQRALILHTGDSINEDAILLDGHLQHFDQQQTDAIFPEQVLPGDKDNLGNELKQQEQQIILAALYQYQGKRGQVAEALGISPRTLRYKIAKMRDEGIAIP